MSSSLRFLMAARRCEIDELERLADTVELVGVLSRLVHALQKERGISNVFLASGGTRFGAQRQAQIAQCEAVQQEVRAALDRLDTEGRQPGNGTRLYNRVAWVLPGLAALAGLRQRIAEQRTTPARATADFVKLIGALLAVVFEAADGATDPEVSRLLVALFNFMQGKEIAGQERAFGSAAFGSGHIDAAGQQNWLHLIDSQERCFEVFAEFVDDAVRGLWQQQQRSAPVGELERLRRVGCSGADGATLDAEISQPWFDLCSQRIDAMMSVEERLAAELRALCMRRIGQARQDLARLQAMMDALGPQASQDEGSAFFDEAPTLPGPAPAPYGRQLERSVLEMVQAQSRQLQVVSDELATARAALNERKLVERAKGLLMAHRQLSEEQAHKLMRQTAMNQNRRLVEVAESVLAMADFLPVRPPA